MATGSTRQIPPPRPQGLGRQSISACEPHRDFIRAQLRLRRNFTAIYQDLVDQFGFSASYNSVKRFAVTLIEHDPAQFDRLEFADGEEVQVDYGEEAPSRYRGTDRYRRPRLFVMTLRYSWRSFRRVVWKSSQETCARLHEQAWRYFGGTARYMVLDNLKEGVIKADLYEPELNAICTNPLSQLIIYTFCLGNLKWPTGADSRRSQEREVRGFHIANPIAVLFPLDKIRFSLMTYR